MLLHYYDVKVSKMELADKVKKDPTPYKKTEDGISFGNPYYGFVGICIPLITQVEGFIMDRLQNLLRSI
jgi:hypothetical protein